jgi:hypothetical protein
MATPSGRIDSWAPKKFKNTISAGHTGVLSWMQLHIGAEYDGSVISRVMTTLSLHRSTELGRC